MIFGTFLSRWRSEPEFYFCANLVCCLENQNELWLTFPDLIQGIPLFSPLAPGLISKY